MAFSALGSVLYRLPVAADMPYAWPQAFMRLQLNYSCILHVYCLLLFFHRFLGICLHGGNQLVVDPARRRRLFCRMPGWSKYHEHQIEGKASSGHLQYHFV